MAKTGHNVLPNYSKEDPSPRGERARRQIDEALISQRKVSASHFKETQRLKRELEVAKKQIPPPLHKGIPLFPHKVSDFSYGMEVEVIEGFFKGQSGTCRRRSDASDRIMVNVTSIRSGEFNHFDADQLRIIKLP